MPPLYDPVVYARDHEILLAESLAGWAEKYPEVPVTRRVRHEQPVQALASVASNARLLVVGCRGLGETCSMAARIRESWSAAPGQLPGRGRARPQLTALANFVDADPSRGGAGYRTPASPRVGPVRLGRERSMPHARNRTTGRGREARLPGRGPQESPRLSPPHRRVRCGSRCDLPLTRARALHRLGHLLL